MDIFKKFRTIARKSTDWHGRERLPNILRWFVKGPTSQ